VGYFVLGLFFAASLFGLVSSIAIDVVVIDVHHIGHCTGLGSRFGRLVQVNTKRGECHPALEFEVSRDRTLININAGLDSNTMITYPDQRLLHSHT
jgi:hypothetical protein